MLYNQPLDQPSNPNAPYVDGNPAAGIQGSIVPAASIEFDQREVVEVIYRANVRGYSDFSNTPCAAPANSDLMQLRKAIEGFIRSTSDLIDTHVTFTVHGSGANFTDLNAALEYLSKFKITHNGYVTLQLAAGQYTYTKPVFIDHPNNDRIQILGATMLAPLPLNESAYALTGYTSAQRANDLTTNLAMLRTKFATELHFINQSDGFDIEGALPTFDSILFTGDQTGNSSVGIHINATTQADRLETNGISAVGFGWAGLELEAALCNINCPVVLIGNGAFGLSMIQSHMENTPGALFCFGNGSAGINIEYTSSVDNYTSALISSQCNAGDGVNCGINSSIVLAGPAAHFFKNGGAGFNCNKSSSGDFQGSGTDFGTNNANGPLVASDASFVNVGGSAHTAGSSPVVGTIGNNNSLIATS